MLCEVLTFKYLVELWFDERFWPENPLKPISVYKRSSITVFPVFSICTCTWNKIDSTARTARRRLQNASWDTHRPISQTSPIYWLLFYTGNSFKEQVDWDWRCRMNFFYLRPWNWRQNSEKGNFPCLMSLHCTELVSVVQSWWTLSDPYPKCERIYQITQGIHSLAARAYHWLLFLTSPIPHPI